MSFCELRDNKIIEIRKIKERELKIFKEIWENHKQRFICSKHLDYYNEHEFRLKTYLEKKSYPFDNDTNIIGSFNENTKKIIKGSKLCDGQGVCAYLDFEKGLIYFGDVL